MPGKQSSPGGLLSLQRERELFELQGGRRCAVSGLWRPGSRSVFEVRGLRSFLRISMHKLRRSGRRPFVKTVSDVPIAWVRRLLYLRRRQGLQSLQRREDRSAELRELRRQWPGFGSGNLWKLRRIWRQPGIHLRPLQRRRQDPVRQLCGPSMPVVWWSRTKRLRSMHRNRSDARFGLFPLRRNCH